MASIELSACNTHALQHKVDIGVLSNVHAQPIIPNAYVSIVILFGDYSYEVA